MEIDFSTLTRSRFIVLAIPNIINCSFLSAPSLRIAIHDSPVLNPLDRDPRIAVLIVPERRERDWIYSTDSGHLQLLFHFDLSRLIIVGNRLNPNVQPSIYNRPLAINKEDKDTMEGLLKLLLLVFYPNVCFTNGLPQPLFLTYNEDDVLYRVIQRFVGPCVGEFLVDDVELEGKEFRRRLIFREMPTLIQSQATLIPKSGDAECNLGGLGLESLRNMEGVQFLIETKILVEPYLKAMVSALFLIASPVNQRIKQRIIPRALCLGVGGGCLLSFLRTQLGFEVAGVEIDEAVVTAARNYFGLTGLTSIKLDVGDAIKLIEQTANSSNVNNVDGLNSKFDVVMVDLVSSVEGRRITAPPPQFVVKSVIQAMTSRLHDHGLLVIHVISPNHIVESLIEMLKDDFHKVYKIDALNYRDFVLIAKLTPVVSNDHANAFLEGLRSVNLGSYMNSIQELL